MFEILLFTLIAFVIIVSVIIYASKDDKDKSPKRSESKVPDVPFLPPAKEESIVSKDKSAGMVVLEHQESGGFQSHTGTVNKANYFPLIHLKSGKSIQGLIPIPQEELSEYIKEGDILPFAKWDWLVLNVNREWNTLMVITKNLVGMAPFNQERKEVNWTISSLREHLNLNFLEKNFTPIEVSFFMDIEMPNTLRERSKLSNPAVPTVDKLFLLSIEEYDLLFRQQELVDPLTVQEEEKSSRKTHTIKTSSGNRAIVVEDPIWWWLRSPGKLDNYTAVVTLDGDVVESGAAVDNILGGVRPAAVLNLYSLFQIGKLSKR